MNKKLNESERKNSDIILEMNKKVGAVVITYNPNDQFFERLFRIASQVDMVLVYDNCSSKIFKINLEKTTSLDKVIIVYGEKNIGVASALNYGLNYFQKYGFELVITFDQDSFPSSNMINELLLSYYYASDPAKVAIVGPNIVDEATPDNKSKWLRQNPKLSLFFERVSINNLDLEDVSIVITSGSLINIDIYQKIGPYIDELFIDYVDTEYCLRAKLHGYLIIASHKALLYHNLGSRQECKTLVRTFRPTFHKPFRRYYIARNQIYLMKKYGLKFPYWTLFEIITTLYNFFRILFFEGDKVLNIKYILIGYFHAILGRYGKIEIQIK
jgi:rhamnosyltransferase